MFGLVYHFLQEAAVCPNNVETYTEKQKLMIFDDDQKEEKKKEKEKQEEKQEEEKTKKRKKHRDEDEGEERTHTNMYWIQCNSVYSIRVPSCSNLATDFPT